MQKICENAFYYVKPTVFYRFSVVIFLITWYDFFVRRNSITKRIPVFNMISCEDAQTHLRFATKFFATVRWQLNFVPSSF